MFLLKVYVVSFVLPKSLDIFLMKTYFTLIIASQNL